MAYFNRARQVALAIGLMYLVGLWGLTRLPIQQGIALEENGADITYQIARRFVLLPNACVTYSWQVEGIQAILFDGQGTTGDNSAQFCDFSRVPPLRIDFSDGNTAFYWLMPTVLGKNPFVLLGVLLAAGLLSYALVPPNVAQPVARGLNLIVVWTVVTFLVVEALFRGWVGLTGTDTAKLLYMGSPQAIANANRNYVQIPFVNYMPSPLRDDVNAMGFRGDAVALDKPADTYRILALGGSTTYGLALEVDETWPAYLQTMLHEDYGHDHVEVINAGVEGYNSMNSLVNFAMRGVELSPDMVFIYHGANDSAHEGLSADCYRGENLYLGFAGASTFDFNDPNLGPSALLRFVNLSLGRIPDPTLDQDFYTGFAQSPCDTDGAANDAPTRYFERNLSHIMLIATAHDVQPVLSTFTFEYLNDLEQVTAYMNYKRIPDFNATVQAVAEEYGVPLVDLAAELPDNADYWQEDTIHQTAAGTYAQAEIYAAFLDASGLLDD